MSFMSFTSFIESPLFPVSRLSKESYKERKAVSGQTLTGLGKWWGRKPLVLVRATIIGLLQEATTQPTRDLDVFLRLMTMDEASLEQRRSKAIPAKAATDFLSAEQRTRLLKTSDKPAWDTGKSSEGQAAAFARMGYDNKLKYCDRPEQIEGPSPAAWAIINAHCGTTAKSLQEWVEQRGQTLFGHTPRVGDAFCGGGSIPFEAARLGCEAYGSDLNPVAALLTWAALNIMGGGPEVQAQVRAAQEAAFAKTDAQITAWGIEHNEAGWRADAYLYCVETDCPNCNWAIPLAPNWIISEKYKVCGVLRPDANHQRYHIDIVTGADKKDWAFAKTGTVRSSRLECPHCQTSSSISGIRGDDRSKGSYGLRMWDNEDLVPRPGDTFQERLYCIRYLDAEGARHYISPTPADLEREARVLTLMQERFADWQERGYIPSTPIPDGDKTEEPKRTRGWTHWHHLFTPRQLLYLGLFRTFPQEGPIESTAISISTNHLAHWNAKLCMWLYHNAAGGHGTNSQVFTNQAINPMYVYSATGIEGTTSKLVRKFNFRDISRNGVVKNLPASEVKATNEFWITDPPYADAVNYHEVGDFFLAWHEKVIQEHFAEWANSNRSALAVKGTGESFNRSMVEVYANLASHMPDNGAQVVMFTHQDAGVWADLALILWASGLRVTAAWTIQTETDSAGLKTGNYVQGTVLMVLRKQTEQALGFLSDIQLEVEDEVKRQIDAMRRLDPKENPNFGDADYQLAAYAAALRVLTGYAQIGDIDVQRELARNTKGRKREESKVVAVIESAVRVAMDYLVPVGIEAAEWLQLTAPERFYLKGLEIESGGEYRNGVYTEMARGFGLHDYANLLESGKSNQTRLKTATEFGRKELGGSDFGRTLLRRVLFAVKEVARTEAPAEGLNYLKDSLRDIELDYWERRRLMVAVLVYVEAKTQGLESWAGDRAAVGLLRMALVGDGV